MSNVHLLYPLSLVFAHVPRSRLPVLASVSKPYNATSQLTLYRTLELSADDADTCIAWLAVAPHLAQLVTTLELRACPHSHGALELTLARPFNARSVGSHITRLHLRPARRYTALCILRRLFWCARPCAFQDSRTLHRRRLPTALRDVGYRPAALLSALGGALKELELVLAPDVDIDIRGWLLGTLANTGTGLEVLKMSPSNGVALQALCKQVGSHLPNVQTLRTPCLKASLVTEAAVVEGVLSSLTLGHSLNWDRHYAALCFHQPFIGRSSVGSAGYA